MKNEKKNSEKQNFVSKFPMQLKCVPAAIDTNNNKPKCHIY